MSKSRYDVLREKRKEIDEMLETCTQVDAMLDFLAPGVRSDQEPAERDVDEGGKEPICLSGGALRFKDFLEETERRILLEDFFDDVITWYEEEGEMQDGWLEAVSAVLSVRGYLVTKE